MAELKDSGTRREFETGAVRDIAEGKGRCDLMPLTIIGALMDNDSIISAFECFRESGDDLFLYDAANLFIEQAFKGSYSDAFLELAKHYEDGARKYSDRNWENGIPLHCFIDSGVRHYLKFKRGDNDEPHDRAFLWNLIGAIWTYARHPELDDYTISDEHISKIPMCYLCSLKKEVK